MRTSILIALISILTTGCLTAGYTPINYGNLGGTRHVTMEFLNVADPFWITGLGDMRRQKMFEAVFSYCGSYPHLTNTMVLPESRLYTYKCED